MLGQSRRVVVAFTQMNLPLKTSGVNHQSKSFPGKVDEKPQQLNATETFDSWDSKTVSRLPAPKSYSSHH